MKRLLLLIAPLVLVLSTACSNSDSDATTTTLRTEITELKISAEEASPTLTATQIPTPTTTTNGVRAQPGGQGGGKSKPADRYACTINSAGYCVFTGTPHQSGINPGTADIVDRKGNFLFRVNEAVAVNSSGELLTARGTPASNGDNLQKYPHAQLSNDEKAFHKVMAIMFPIRNALMYDIADVNKDKWDALVAELKQRGIKETTFTSGATPRDNYYGRQGIFALAKNPVGKDIHHDVMKFLEEAGLYLLCHVTSEEFGKMLKETHPEGHDPCGDVQITARIPF